MADIFHAGERAVQRRAGVEEDADDLAHVIRPALSETARVFLRSQSLLIIGSVSPCGVAWASLATGEPGFIQSPDAQSILIDSGIPRDDPLWANVSAGSGVGLLAIEFMTRRRIRVNGAATESPCGIRVHVAQAYSNCSKYIQRREVAARESTVAAEAIRSLELNFAQKEWIRIADTFFIASSHIDAGADVSHRGGAAGFVHVAGPRRLTWADYAGNNLFQTLGNLTLNHRAGLLFVDWADGSTLQLTGRATIDWDVAIEAKLIGVQRWIQFEIEDVRETRSVSGLRWRFVDASPNNPRVESGS